MYSIDMAVTIAAGAAHSGVLDFRNFVGGIIHVPPIWTAASLGLKVNPRNSEQVTLQTLITGIATSVTQPAGADTLEVIQAAHVAGDVGRGIVIEGGNAQGVAITETIYLHATATNTAVAGTTTFTSVSGIYTEDGGAIGAQNVTVRRETGGATVGVLVAANSHLGAPIPAQSDQVGAQQILVTGPNSDATYVTLVGVRSGAAVRERVRLNAASPAVIHTAGIFDTLTRICVGEFTNAAEGSVKTQDPWQPLRDEYGTLISIPVVAGRSYTLPVECFSARHFKLWSQTAGSSVVQTAVRRLVVDLKG